MGLAAWQVTSSLTGHVAGPTLFCLAVPKHKVAVLPGHGRGLQLVLLDRGSQHMLLGPLHEEKR
jgi:hypothetical protein